VKSSDVSIKVATLALTTNPPGADIFLDDQKVAGKTPLDLDLEVKQHTLFISKEGYHELAIVIDAKTGKKMQLNLNMRQR
ncbi:MAG: PEGA domain-containing protein, partial [Thermodesulfobacteriota bacterium]